MSLPDVRVRTKEEKGTSWIYRLAKEDLQKELVLRNLDESGTVDVLRKRLADHVREEYAAALEEAREAARAETMRDMSTHGARTSTPEPEGVTHGSRSEEQLGDKARKWGVQFDGKSDPIWFLERIDELSSGSNIARDQLLPALPWLLKDRALLWFRNNRTSWQTWTEFERAFRRYYIPSHYLDNLEDQIKARKQRDGEPCRDFIEDMRTLMRRHGSMSAEQQVRRIFTNLDPEIQVLIDEDSFTDLDSLLNKIEQAERKLALLREKRKAQRRQEPRLNVLETNIPAQKASSRVRENPNQKSSPQPLICFNCRKPGHISRNCRAPRQISCNVCKKAGVRTEQCCRKPAAGNANRAAKNRGNSSSRH